MTRKVGYDASGHSDGRSDVSLLPFNKPALDLSEFAVSGRKQAWFEVFAWSGRDLVRIVDSADRHLGGDLRRQSFGEAAT